MERGIVEKVPNIVIEPPGPNAKKIIEMDTEFVATSTKAAPIVVDRASGAVIHDVDGNTMLDFASGVAVLNIGHCHPKVVKAVQDQAAKLMHFAGTDYYYDIQSELAKRLCRVGPGNYKKKIFFSNSGTEAIEAAMKLARWNRPDRKQFIAFIGAFHGRTLGSLSLTASKKVQRARYTPMIPGVTHIPYAYCYRCPYHLEYPSCGIWCADILKEIYFETITPPEEVAALFMEPVQGEGGYIVPPVGWAKKIFDIINKEGILLVDDEVQAGMGRSGKMWCIEHHSIEPDIACMAKSLGSGLPIAATTFRTELDWKVKGAHSNTYGGNCVACASAMATLDVYEEEGIVEMAAKKGVHLRKRLDELMEKYEQIGDVRGFGMMQAIELVEDRKSKTPACRLRDKVDELCMKRGLITLGCGKSGIRVIPPIVTPIEQIDSGLDVLDGALRDAVRM